MWYEALFFNVRDRLHNRDWITRNIVPEYRRRTEWMSAEAAPAGLRFQSIGFALPHLDWTVKYLSYVGGPVVCDAGLNGFTAGQTVPCLEEIASWHDQFWSHTIQRRSYQASLQFEINQNNVMDLFATHARMIKLDQGAESKVENQANFECHIRAMIDSIPPIGVGEGARFN